MGRPQYQSSLQTSCQHRRRPLALRDVGETLSRNHQSCALGGRKQPLWPVRKLDHLPLHHPHAAVVPTAGPTAHASEHEHEHEHEHELVVPRAACGERVWTVACVWWTRWAGVCVRRRDDEVRGGACGCRAERADLVGGHRGGLGCWRAGIYSLSFSQLSLMTD